MIETSLFERVGALVSAAKARELADHEAFLKFHREVVERLPTEAIKAFGTLGGVKVRIGGKVEDYGIELTATDYIWWKRKIEAEGVRFVSTPASVQLQMLERLGRHAEQSSLEPAERKALLAILDEASGQ